MNIHLSASFIASYKKRTKRNTILKTKIKKTIRALRDNPRHPSLRLHKLTGGKYNTWSVSVEQDVRMLFSYTEDGVILVDVGSHDEVY